MWSPVLRTIEKIYIGLSIFPLLLTEIIKRGWLFLEITLGHGAIWVTAFYLLVFCLVMGIWGIVLVFQAKKRVLIFWTLITTTLLASSPMIYSFGYFVIGAFLQEMRL